MITSRFPDILRNNSRGVNDRNEAAAGQEVESCQQLLTNFSLSILPTFLERILESRRVQSLSSYTMLTFELLYVLHPGISNLLKECIVSYLPLKRLRHGKQAERR